MLLNCQLLKTAFCQKCVEYGEKKITAFHRISHNNSPRNSPHFLQKFGFFPIIAPKISSQIIYSPPIMVNIPLWGAVLSWGAIMGKTQKFTAFVSQSLLKFTRNSREKINNCRSRIRYRRQALGKRFGPVNGSVFFVIPRIP